MLLIPGALTSQAAKEVQTMLAGCLNQAELQAVKDEHSSFFSFPGCGQDKIGSENDSATTRSRLLRFNNGGSGGDISLHLPYAP